MSRDRAELGIVEGQLARQLGAAMKVYQERALASSPGRLPTVREALADQSPDGELVREAGRRAWSMPSDATMERFRASVGDILDPAGPTRREASATVERGDVARLEQIAERMPSRKLFDPIAETFLETSKAHAAAVRRAFGAIKDASLGRVTQEELRKALTAADVLGDSVRSLRGHVQPEIVKMASKLYEGLGPERARVRDMSPSR